MKGAARVRGQLWTFVRGGHGEDDGLLLVVQHDALNGVAATVVGTFVTAVPQRAGAPVVVPLGPSDSTLGVPLWVKVTQMRTVAAADARQRAGEVTAEALLRVDEALAQVLGLGRRSGAALRLRSAAQDPPDEATG